MLPIDAILEVLGSARRYGCFDRVIRARKTLGGRHATASAWLYPRNPTQNDGRDLLVGEASYSFFYFSFFSSHIHLSVRTPLIPPRILVLFPSRTQHHVLGTSHLLNNLSLLYCAKSARRVRRKTAERGSCTSCHWLYNLDSSSEEDPKLYPSSAIPLSYLSGDR